MIIQLNPFATTEKVKEKPLEVKRTNTLSYKDKVIQDRLVMLFLFVLTFVTAILYSQFFGV